MSVGRYVADRNPSAARKLVRRIVDATRLIEHNPLAGCAGRMAGTRELVVSGTAYIVPYRINQGRCEILAVYHAAREWPDVFE